MFNQIEKLEESLHNIQFRQHWLQAENDCQALETPSVNSQTSSGLNLDAVWIMEMSSGSAVNLPFINVTSDGPKHVDTTQPKAKFEELWTDLLDRHFNYKRYPFFNDELTLLRLCINE
ncbi:hypothetical protein Tco_0833094, partial [Tanacetum coccineum]